MSQRMQAAGCIPWTFYAISALSQWLKFDLSGAEAICNDDVVVVKRLMQFYRIARNFRGIDDDRRLELLDNVRVAAKVVEDSAGDCNVLDEQVQCLAVRYDPQFRLVSAASKLIYLAVPQHGVIYDSNALAALGFSARPEYKRYLQRWQEELQIHKPEIDAALSRLTNLPDDVLPLHLARSRECCKTLMLPWFHRQVFDLFLWNQGAPIRR